MQPLQSLTGLAFSSRLLAALLLANAGIVAFSNLNAQVEAPSASDVSPTANTEVSSMIHTGCGYDAWTGSAHRRVVDLEVPGAVSGQGLKWVRTYNSGTPDSTDLNAGWSFSWTWRRWGRSWSNDPIGVHLPDGGLWRITEPGMKLRWDERDAQGNPCGLSCLSADAYLYLEDGSKVHMDLYREPPEYDQSPPRTYWIDHYTPTYVDDPYGRRTTLTYEEVDAPGCGGCVHIRLAQVTDPSGRFIRIRYKNDHPSIWTDPSWEAITRVEGSDGSWVNYSWPASNHFHVDYSDGTVADYFYGDTTYLTECYLENCTFVTHGWKLIAAWDTHADSPMQSIYYEYKAPGSFEGQIRAEHQLASATFTTSPAAGAAVSTFTSNSCPTHSWSTSPDCPSATQTETRGDGPTRTIYMEQATQHVPLVKTKSDFNGVNEIFTYDPNNYLLTAKDRNGYTTTYTNEPVIGNPTQILHPDGTHIDYTYSDNANPYHISTVTDELVKTTTYTRGSVGSLTNLITRIDYPDGAYETFAYNSFGQVLTHRRKNGAYDHAVYNSSGLLAKLWNPTTATSVTDADPHITLTYYPLGDAWQDRVKTVIYPANSSGLVAFDTYEYDRALDANGVTDPNGNPVHGRGLVTKITHADQTFKTFKYDKFGNKTSETDETAHTTTYTYDAYRRLKTVKNALSQTTSYDYTATNGASSYSHTTNSVRKVTSPTLVVTGQKYDNNFRLASKIEAEGSTIAATTTFGYDNNGNQTSMTDPLAHTTRTSYDNRNRKKTMTEAYGTSLARTTTWDYDEASNVKTITRPDSTQETKTYDEMHRVLTDTVPQTSTVNLTTSFVYNPSGTLQQVTDPKGQVTKFVYDAADLKTKMSYPDIGTNTNDYQAWTYDDVKNLISRRTVNGVTQNFTYDNRNRKITMFWTNPTNVSNFTQEWAGFGYDGASRLTSAQNGIGTPGTGIISTVTRSYDAAGRLTLDQQAVAGLATKNVNYVYDSDGKQTRLYVTGAGYDYTFSYDPMARFEKIMPTGGSVAFQYYYDAASNEADRHNWLNGVDQIYTRDALNRMTRRDLENSTGTLSYEAYHYDPMSRLTSVARGDAKMDQFGYYLDGELYWAQYGLSSGSNSTVVGPPPDGTPPPADATPTPPPDDPTMAWPPTDGSGTDSVDGLLSSDTQSSPDGTSGSDSSSTAPDDGLTGSTDTTGTSSSASRSVTYSLDKAGNRLSVVDTGVTQTYSRNILNEYTVAVGTAVSNGSEHEIKSYQGINYAYINDERLSAVTVTGSTNNYQLAYDALGRCVKRTVSGLTNYYVYDGEKPILQYNVSGGLAAWNLYGKGIDEILLRVDLAHSWTLYYQQDHEGSVSHITNVNGYTIATYRYDVFGAPTFYNYQGTLVSTSPFNNRFLFTGREYASTFGFYEYRARAYHPTLGRFMSEDPKLFDAGDYNLYRYCHNDPEDMTDPMGLWPVPPAGEAPPPPPPPEGFFQREMDHTPNANATQRAFQQAATMHSVTAQAFIQSPTASGMFTQYRGDSHGPTDSPTDQFRLSSTLTFNETTSGPQKTVTGSTNASYRSDGTYVGQAVPHYSGSGTVAGHTATIQMSAWAKNPDYPAGPAISYKLKGTLDLSSRRASGSFTRTAYPSFQIFVDGHRIYNSIETRSSFGLFLHPTDSFRDREF